ncbi:MAG TPA: YggT family protein [Nevskiales bacterium]|nr:YggT family protein [Nevskiales bacterium]
MNFGLENPLIFLIDTLFGLYVLVLILRFILQAVHADFYNPLSQFVWRVTNQPVGLLQRALPRWQSYDFAALALALALVALNLWIDLSLVGARIAPLTLLLWSLLKLVAFTLNLYFFSILIQTIMSWVNPGMPSPASAVLWSINEPLLKPVRNLLPPIGGLDLSPLVVLIAIQVLLRSLPALPGLL